MIERFSTAGLDPGWYRLRQEGSHNQTATGIFHITAGAPTPAPLPPTGQQALCHEFYRLLAGSIYVFAPHVLGSDTPRSN